MTEAIFTDRPPDQSECPSDVGDFLAVSVEVSIERKSLEYWSKIDQVWEPKLMPAGLSNCEQTCGKPAYNKSMARNTTLLCIHRDPLN